MAQIPTSTTQSFLGPSTPTASPSVTWPPRLPIEKYSFGVKFGYPGSKIREFIKTNYHQWNVKNWIEFATEQFCYQFAGVDFDFSYTPKHDLGILKQITAGFNGVGSKDELIVQPKNNGDLFARVSITLPIDYAEFSNIFSGEGNGFFFSGDFEAEKVDESNWYDVKRISITSLNFIDKLGRRQQVLPKA